MKKSPLPLKLQRIKQSEVYSFIETEQFYIFCKGNDTCIYKLYLTKKEGYRFKYDNNKNNPNDLNFKNVRQWQKEQMMNKSTTRHNVKN